MRRIAPCPPPCRVRRALLATTAVTVAVAASLATPPLAAQEGFAPELGRLAPAAPVAALDRPLAIAPGAAYDPAVPTPSEVLGFPLGARAATPEEVGRCLDAWAEHPRVEVVEYARTWEGRPLRYVVVTSPDNHARLGEIKAGMARLADPRGLAEAEADRLVDELPAVAWLAYSIHGDETSGTDAAPAVLHHLVAGTGPEVAALLDRVVVIVDPMMNPDGRARFTAQAAQHRGAAPNLDDQSLVHAGHWPWGRGNHYFFDLNRDWILGVHPESRGRIRAVAEWHPLLFVDAHEMGSQDTFLFSPQREPANPHQPESRGRWNALFAADQAAAFDRRGWAYYTGEWNEGWYPGYSDAWAAFRGAVGILYEQAQVVEDAVRRPGGALATYREAVEHQAVSSLANLDTLARHREELLADFLAERRAAVAPAGRYAERVFAVLPTANRTRLARFADLLALQGFETHRLARAVEADSVDPFGRRARRTLPAGTLLVANRQPEAPLVAALLEPDLPLPADYVERERRELLRRGESTIYDLTAWSAPLLHGLDLLVLPGALPAGAEPWEGETTGTGPGGAGTGGAAAGENAVAWVADGADDASVALAARLLERGFEVRLATRDFALAGRPFAAGSVLVLRADHGERWGEAAAAAGELAAGLALPLVPVASGLGTGDLPDLGGGWFRRLEPPRIALVGRDGISAYDFGTTWFLLDRELGIRHSHLDGGATGFFDLRRYNVIVLPDRWYGRLSEGELAALKSWVEAGGTLVAIGGSAAEIAKEGPGISQVRLLPDALGDLDRFEAAVLAEHAGTAVATPPAETLWSHQAPAEVVYPWPPAAPARPPKEELERREAWQDRFMPSGAILAGRVDPEHWLTLASGDTLPLLTGRQPVLMAAPPVAAPVRFGVYREAGGDREPGGAAAASPEDGAAAQRIGWSLLPAGRSLDLRISGLLWPEAAHRLASSAWVTRESLGRGQVILFAHPPSFRAATPATARVLLHALVYGPGLGTSAPIAP